jgi:hypothetical protein
MMGRLRRLPERCLAKRETAFRNAPRIGKRRMKKVKVGDHFKLRNLHAICQATANAPCFGRLRWKYFRVPCSSISDTYQSFCCFHLDIDQTISYFSTVI